MTVRVCKRCDRLCKARSPYCYYHWLMRQTAMAQTEAAQLRLAEHFGALKDVPKAQWPNGERWCKSCQSFCPTFYFNGTLCRGCASQRQHGQRVQAVYGITGEQYLDILKAQDGRCAICTRKPRKQRMAVDHNHKTGEVRGLLCSRCNHRLLGAASDDIETLRRAVHYLEYPPARKVLET